jgi:membrane fusion protein, multidrug efflux system
MTDSTRTTTPAATPTRTDPVPTPARGPSRTRLVLLFVLLIAIAVGTWMYLRGLTRESTDDAFVAADVQLVNAKVPGRILEIPVRDNQLVTAGQVLAIVEDADYQSRVDQAKAAVDLAGAQVREANAEVGLVTATAARAVELQQAKLAAAEARLQQVQAALAGATTESERAAAEADRYQQLTERAVSRLKLQDLEAARTAAAAALRGAQQATTSAQAEVAAAKARLGTAEAERARVDVATAARQRREAELEQARAALHEAQLQQSYTRIVAPTNGRVTKKSVLPGTFVQTGQTLMALVGTEIWVVANFKETQLQHMQPGLSVSIYVDAYGIELDGHIDSVQSGSGAAFSLLPPENATGNYVKVVQRVPVKIVFDQQPDPKVYHLGPGMSVEPTVHLK